MDTSFDSRYYSIVKRICSLVGLWPYQSQYKRRIMQSLQVLLFYCTCIPPQVNKLRKVWGKDLDTTCMCIPPLLSFVLVACNNATIFQFESEIKMLMRWIETDWQLNLKIEEYKLLVNYTLRTRRLCIMYTSVMYYGIVCLTLVPLISPILDIIHPLNETRVRNLPFDVDYGFDQESYWFWIWLHCNVSACAGAFSFVAADLLYVMLTVHCSYLFALARYKLEHVADSVEEDAMQFAVSNAVRHDKEDNTYVHDDYKLPKFKKQIAAVEECIFNHKKAIKYAQILHRIYKWNLLAAAGLNVIAKSIWAIQLLSKLGHWQDMTYPMVYICAALIHLLLIFLMAQSILDESEKIHESAYLSCWYNMSSKLWKDLSFILMRSRIPYKLTAGNIMVISLESFCKILRTSVSYFTLLASFR